MIFVFRDTVGMGWVGDGLDGFWHQSDPVGSYFLYSLSSDESVVVSRLLKNICISHFFV